MINVYQLYSEGGITSASKPQAFCTREELSKHSDQHWYIELQGITWNGHLLDKGFRIDRARI